MSSELEQNFDTNAFYHDKFSTQKHKRECYYNMLYACLTSGDGNSDEQCRQNVRKYQQAVNTYRLQKFNTVIEDLTKMSVTQKDINEKQV